MDCVGGGGGSGVSVFEASDGGNCGVGRGWWGGGEDGEDGEDGEGEGRVCEEAGEVGF